MADNPYINKVVYGGTTLIDLTSDTVTAGDLAYGVTAHDRSGAQVTGTMNVLAQTTWYGTSSTTASTAAKVVACEGFTLTTGAIIGVLFSTANSASSMTLNVNGTGAITVQAGNASLNSTTNAYNWPADSMVYFMYNGTNWLLITSRVKSQTQGADGGGAWYGTCSTSATTAVKTVACTGFRRTPGAIIAIEMEAGNTVTSSAVKLNINGTGNVGIWYKGDTVTVTNPISWATGDTLLFVYGNGAYCYLGRITADGDIPASDDYVVDSGSSTYWTWRKWDSGVIEAWGWGTFSVSGSTNGAWVGYMDTPVTMASSDYCVFCQVSDYRQLKAYAGEKSTTQFRVAYGSSESCTAQTNFYLKGYWK